MSGSSASRPKACGPEGEGNSAWGSGEKWIAIADAPSDPLAKARKDRWEIQFVGQVWLIGKAVAVVTVLHGAPLPQVFGG